MRLCPRSMASQFASEISIVILLMKKPSPDGARDKWTQWLSWTIRQARNKLDKIQARYKQNYDNILRKQRKHICEGDQV